MNLTNGNRNRSQNPFLTTLFSEKNCRILQNLTKPFMKPLQHPDKPYSMYYNHYSGPHEVSLAPVEEPSSDPLKARLKEILLAGALVATLDSNPSW